MTRDKTVALFLECGAKRTQALTAALAEGRSEWEAHKIANETPKAHWNGWAEALLAERKAMEADGSWAGEQNDWSKRAIADFSFCLFLGKGAVVEDTKAKAAIYKRAADAGQNAISIDLGSNRARFDGFKFPGDAIFDGVAFTGEADFNSATFYSHAWFVRDATFESDAFFVGVTFAEDAYFDSAIFAGNAVFNGSKFTRNASFNRARFSSAVFFRTATFTGDASFQGLHFPKEAFFTQARFGPGRTDFSLATFERVGRFDRARFTGKVDFNAAAGKRTFSMARATFKGVPDFIQAHFEEAPRLDNVQVAQPQGLELLTEQQARELFARWRALKRLAIQAHDTDRELEFNAQEIRAERSASFWPVPVKLHEGKRWLESARSLSGFLYGLFSDYGRSLFRPVLAWAIGIAIFAAFYLSQTEATQRKLELQYVSYVLATAEAGSYALSHSVPCYALDEKPADPNQTRVDGLSEKLRSQTNARAEALHLAFRNAFVVLDGGSDASHRMYGCLYGLELYAGQNPVPIVPSAVSTASAIQKLISGVLIFLFGLALRNMLKVK